MLGTKVKKIKPVLDGGPAAGALSLQLPEVTGI